MCARSGILTALLFVIAIVPASAQKQTDAQAAEKEVRQASEKEVQAFLKKDPQALANLWADEMVVTNPLNKLVTKKQVLDLVHSGFLVINSYDRNVEYFRLINPNTAALAGSETVVWGGKIPLAGAPRHLRFTAIWEKRDGRWLEVLRHANVLPEK
jgi:uncharacterized protein (TIGR02246 family)